jgi:undecaprenyl-diphosphatase
MNMNQQILEYFNHFARKNPLFDKIVIDAVSYLPILMCAVIALIFISGLIKKRADLKITAVHAAVSLVINLILAFGLGHLFFETRPMFAHDNLNLSTAHVNDSSFPSDHATTTMTLALATFPISRFLGWLFIAASLVVCTGKIYLAEHYPLDILLSYGVVIIMRGVYVRFLAKPVEQLYTMVESKLFKSAAANSDL